MLKYSPLAWIITAVWIGLGLLVYRFYSVNREIKYTRKVQVLDQISKKQYKILVCFSISDDVISLCNVAFAIAKRHEAQVIFLHVVEVDQGTRLQEGWRDTEPRNELLQRAQELANKAGISSKSIIKISHRISQGIVDTVDMESCNFILTGRRKESRFTKRLFHSIIDTTLQNTTSEVGILHGELQSKEIRKILIPYSRDIHTQLATEIAPALVDYFGAKISMGIVFSPDSEDSLRERHIEIVKDWLSENELAAEVETIVDDDILHGILQLSRDCDLIVMGGKSASLPELLFAKSLTREITENVQCPVLWLKEFEETESFISSIFKSRRK